MNMKPIFQKTILVLFLSVIAIPAFGQEITGEYTRIGTRCENTGKLVTRGSDAVTELFFYQDGSFEHIFSSYNEPPERPSENEEFLGQEERIRDRHLSWFEEDKARHEEVCEEYGQAFNEEGQDECSSSVKNRMYAQWRANREREAEQEWEEEKNRLEREYDEIISQQVFGDCVIKGGGSYSTSANSLSLSLGDLTATPACGLDNSYPRSVTINYYFENGKLHLVLPADEDSREYCGSSDVAEIYSRY